MLDILHLDGCHNKPLLDLGECVMLSIFSIAFPRAHKLERVSFKRYRASLS